jgi:5'-3' exonuclease
MLTGRHLLVDGKNILCRAIFVRSKDSPIDVFFRIIISNMREAEAEFCHVFWDCPRKETWRRQLYEPYKANRDDNKDPQIGELIALTNKVLVETVPLLGMYQYKAPKLEADDLIHAFVAAHHPVETVILSSDSDLIQLPYRYYSTRQLNPDEGFIERPDVNPVYQKCLIGDKGDNIPGYHGIGPVKSKALLKSNKTLFEFVNADPRTFLFNLNLVDLSMCPFQMRAQFAVLSGLNNPLKFDLNAARGVFSNYKMHPQLHNLDWTKFNRT